MVTCAMRAFALSVVQKGFLFFLVHRPTVVDGLGPSWRILAPAAAAASMATGTHLSGRSNATGDRAAIDAK
jgi:hypothetical protein